MEPPSVIVPLVVIVPPVSVRPSTDPDVATDVTVPLPMVGLLSIKASPDTAFQSLCTFTSAPDAIPASLDVLADTDVLLDTSVSKSVT